MHSFTVDWDTISNEEKDAVVVRVTSVEVEVTGTNAMLALSFSTLLVESLMKILGRSALWQMVGNILGVCLWMSKLTFSCVHMF